jgi:hypothetical protein
MQDEDTAKLAQMVQAVAPGTTVDVEVFRDGTPRSIRVTVSRMPEDAPQPSVHWRPEEVEGLLGMRVQQEQHGVVVAQVAPGRPAAQAGLQRGDVTREVNQTAVSTLEAYHAGTAVLDLSRPVLFLIERHGGTLFVAVRPAPPETVQPSPAAPGHGAVGLAPITEAEVRAFVDALGAASDRKDSEEILKYFAPEAMVEIMLISPFGNQSMRLTRDEFSQHLKQARGLGDLLKVVESQRVRLQIDLSMDGQRATVVEETLATVQAMGMLTMRSRTEATFHLARVRDAIAITAMKTVSHMDIGEGLGSLR